MTGLFVDVSNVYRHLKPERLNYATLTNTMLARYGNLGCQKAYLTNYDCPPGFLKVLTAQGFSLESTTDTRYNWSFKIGLDVIDWSAQSNHAVVVSNDPMMLLLVNWFKINMPSFKLTMVGSNLSYDIEQLADDYFYLTKDLML